MQEEQREAMFNAWKLKEDKNIKTANHIDGLMQNLNIALNVVKGLN